MNRILIFGATSAIAAAAARLWVARGARVHLVGRSPAKLEALQQDLQVRAGGGAAAISARSADLDRLAELPALLDEAWAALGGGVDVVLIAQGTLPDQAACEASLDETLAQLHTNGVAVVALCTLLAQRMAPGSALAVITSVAGDRGRQSNYVYGAAKGLVSRFLQGLRNRLASRDIAVVDIRPGFVDTPMTAAIAKKGALWAQPTAVARGIVAAVDRRADIVYLPAIWRLIMLIITSIPEKIFKKLKL